MGGKRTAEKWFGGREQRRNITRKRERKRVHREQPLYYSQANRRNDIRAPFVSLVVRGTKQLYALPTLSATLFVLFFSFVSTALPPPSPPLLVIFCHIFIALLLLSPPFHPPGPFFLPHRFTLSTDSAIRQIARTNDEPPGDPFRTLYGFSIPGSARSSVSRDLSYFKVFHVRDLFGTKRSCDPCSCGSRVCKYLRRSFVFFLFHPGITGYKVIRDTWVLRPRLYKLDSSEANFSKYLINCK